MSSRRDKTNARKLHRNIRKSLPALKPNCFIAPVQFTPEGFRITGPFIPLGYSVWNPFQLVSKR